MKPKLAISFSGGRTSAVMTKLCVDKFSETHDIAITFANTGCEHDNTLKFVDQCDKHFGWNVVWVEAVVNPEKGKGIRHRIVTFETASRNGKPFEDYIKKEGLPGPSNPGCTTRLKELPMNSYLKRELGWSGYWTAIGIRADEIDRVSEKRIEKKFVYPLVDAGWTKEDVKRECASWPFDLDLKGEHYGNCTWCWKKSLRKLMTLAKDDVWIFEFPLRMEFEHPRKYTSTTLVYGNGDLYAGEEEVVDRIEEIKDTKIFRNNLSTIDIVEMARTKDFEPYVDIDQLDFGFSRPNYDVFLDTGSACGESCEIGADS
jgi:hypothetical protein|tara:strand:+ start:42 stop:986 length:945 start_codon:yes stop_codon:yes gene_type:complete